MRKRLKKEEAKNEKDILFSMWKNDERKEG